MAAASRTSCRLEGVKEETCVKVKEEGVKEEGAKAFEGGRANACAGVPSAAARITMSIVAMPSSKARSFPHDLLTFFPIDY